MKNVVSFIAGALVASVLFVGVGFAYAQVTNPPDLSSPDNGYYSSMNGYRGFNHGRMMRGTQAQGFNQDEGPLHAYMIEALAKVFDIDADKLDALHDEGKTMWEFAQELGYDQDKFQSLMIEARQLALENAVVEGIITQEQANWMIERMNQRFKYGFGVCRGDGTQGDWDRMPRGRWFDQIED